MGYGEYIGGGSVDWRVVHGNGGGATPTPHGGRGRDLDPPTGDGGRFLVYVNGVEVANVDCDTGRIVVLWGSHVPGSSLGQPENPAPSVANIEQAGARRALVDSAV